MTDAAQKKLFATFAKEVVRVAKSNLSGSKGPTKLESSIKYNLSTKDGELIVTFEMADYGKFVDKGVRGSGGYISTGKYKGNWRGKRFYETYEGKRKQSPYSFGKTRDGGLTRGLDKWVIKKGLDGVRDPKTGKFISRATLKMLLARDIYIRGLHGISFLQKSLKTNLKGFKQKYTVAFKEDLTETINAVIKKKK